MGEQLISEFMTRAEADALALARRKWGEDKPPVPAEKSPNAAWHIVQCVGKSDAYALEWLKELKVDVYYPMVRELRPVPRNKLSKKQRAAGVEVKKPRLVPFLPRYMFVNFDMGKDGWREIFGFAGIGGMVCEGDLPVRVPEAMISSLRDREIDGAIPGKTPAKLIFGLGQQVKVLSGPFAEFMGIVEKLPSVAVEDIDADTRIRVAVNLFGRATPIDLEVSQIERV